RQRSAPATNTSSRLSSSRFIACALLCYLTRPDLERLQAEAVALRTLPGVQRAGTAERPRAGAAEEGVAGGAGTRRRAAAAGDGVGHAHLHVRRRAVRLAGVRHA